MSSAENHTFTYFDLSQTKDILHIGKDDDEDDKILRNTWGPQADRWIINKMTPFAEQLPLQGDDLETVMGAANKYAASLYKLGNKSFEESRELKKFAVEDLDALFTALKARHVPRTRIVAASQSYDTETPLFSQQTVLDF